MDRGQARSLRLSRESVLVTGLLLCGCSTLEQAETALGFRPAPMPQTQVRATPPVEMPPPEAVMPMAPESAPPMEMASVERPPPPPVVPARPLPPAMPPRPKPAEPPLPVPDINTLIGADFASILTVFRSPDDVQKNALYVVWVYSPPGCTLQLYFYPDIRTTQFHLLKYDLKSAVGDMPAIDPDCMQDILAPRRRGAPPP